MNKKVTVVIVTYNGAKWIDKNIQSLLQSVYPVAIIVVDNNSTDNSVMLLKKYDEHIDIILSGVNLGFGKANNIGIQKAMSQNSDYIFLLNQDTWIFDHTISRLVTTMESRTEFGILSPMHYKADEVTPDESFKTYLSRSTQYNGHIATVPFVNAAAWMMSRQCIEKVGLFEPMFSHYGEDRNYCDRVKFHGFTIGIDENAAIVHNRIITRNFKKDIRQSQYKILATLLNINNASGKSYLLGLKEVFGLPKYFSGFYAPGKTVILFFRLLVYYIGKVFDLQSILKARQKSAAYG